MKDANVSVIRGDVYSCYLQNALFSPPASGSKTTAATKKIDPKLRIKGKQIAVALTKLMKYLELDHAAEEIRVRIIAAGDPEIFLRMLILKYGYRMSIHNTTDLADYREYAADEYVFMITVLKNIIPEIHERLRCIHRDHSQINLIKCKTLIEQFAADLLLDFQNDFFAPAKKETPLKKN